MKSTVSVNIVRHPTSKLKIDAVLEISANPIWGGKSVKVVQEKGENVKEKKGLTKGKKKGK
jgi:hypothetical protein